MVTQDELFPLRKVSREDASHLTWGCTIIKHLWKHLDLSSVQRLNPLNNKEWLANQFSKADERQRNFIANSLCAVWFKRNKLIHEGQKTFMQDLLGFINGYIQ